MSCEVTKLGETITSYTWSLNRVTTTGKHWFPKPCWIHKFLKRSDLDIDLEKIRFQKTSTNDTQRRQQKRNIIWFNLPFSKSVVTKIGKTFPRLIDKNFPPHHKLHKLFNQNNIKISYCCMPNVKSIIKKHNKTVLDPPTNNSERSCNCINRETCLLQ